MGQERGKQMILYHTGYQEIRYPDIRFGRKNADFGLLYEQVVIKTERALEHLRWIAAEKLTADMVSEFRRIVKQEEAAYQEAIAKILDTE